MHAESVCTDLKEVEVQEEEKAVQVEIAEDSAVKEEWVECHLSS